MWWIHNSHALKYQTLFLTCTFQLMSSRESSKVSSFCPSSDDTLIWLPNLSAEGLEGLGVRVADVDLDSGLGWGVLILFFQITIPIRKVIFALILFLSFFLFHRIICPIYLYGYGIFHWAELSCGGAYSTVLRGLNVWRLRVWRLRGWYFCWLGRCKGLLYSFCFIAFDCGESIFLHKTWVQTNIDFSGFREFILIALSDWWGYGSGYGLVAMALLLSGVGWYGAAMVCFHLR